MLCDGSLNDAGVFSIQLLAAPYSFLRLQLPRIISSFTWFVGWLKSANTSVFKGFLTWVYYSESVNATHNACSTQCFQPPQSAAALSSRVVYARVVWNFAV